MMRLRMLLPAMLLGVLLALGAFSAACGGDSKDDKGDKTPVATVATETPEATDDAGAEQPTEETDAPSSDLEEYFQDLDAAENELRSGQASTDETFAAIDDSTPPDEVIAAFEEAKAVVDEFIAGMQDLDPPSEATAAHEETIAAFQVVSGIVSDAIDVVEGGGTAQEAAVLLSSPEATEADTALDATCNALQSIADSHGIAVDLRCDVGG